MGSLQSVYTLFPGKYVEHMVFNESLNVKVENIYYHLQYSLRLWKNHGYDTQMRHWLVRVQTQVARYFVS